jgi:hypothetical protein
VGPDKSKKRSHVICYRISSLSDLVRRYSKSTRRIPADAAQPRIPPAACCAAATLLRPLCGADATLDPDVAGGQRTPAPNETRYRELTRAEMRSFSTSTLRKEAPIHPPARSNPIPTDHSRMPHKKKENTGSVAVVVFPGCLHRKRRVALGRDMVLFFAGNAWQPYHSIRRGRHHRAAKWWRRKKFITRAPVLEAPWY